MNEDAFRYLGFIEGGGDPLTSQWLGAGSFMYPLSTCLLYLTMIAVWGGNSKPINWNLRPIIRIYNLGQVKLKLI